MAKDAKNPKASSPKQKKPKKHGTGDTLTLSMTQLHPTGEGVTHQGARPIRVRGAFPDEEVTARVDHAGKHVTFATRKELVRRHSGRRLPMCTRHEEHPTGRCTGCAIMGLREDAQRDVLKDMLRDAFSLEVDEVVSASESIGYRMSAKRIAFGAPGTMKLGSFARGTHNPADMRGCLVDHPRITEVADAIADCAKEMMLGGYDERATEGARDGLRGAWLRTDGDKVIVTLITSVDDREVMRELARRLTSADGVAYAVIEGRTNSLHPDRYVMLRGIEELTVRGNKVGPLGFLQPNPEVAETMYAALLADAEATLAFDLYAGSGATTRVLQERVARVVPCERNEESASLLGVPAESAEAFLERQLEEGAKPELVVANPPRKGLGEEVVTQLLALDPKEIRIMACGPAALAKDLEGLRAGYTVTRLLAYDTLPQTPHVELIAHLVRS